jgi:hypothetical protein
MVGKQLVSRVVTGRVGCFLIARYALFLFFYFFREGVSV